MRTISALLITATLATLASAQPVGTWTRLSTGGGPNATTFRGMIFDSNRGVLVAWDALNRWEWNGSSWTATGPDLALSYGLSRAPQMRQGLAFDPGSNQLARAFVQELGPASRGRIDVFECAGFSRVFSSDNLSVSLRADGNNIENSTSASITIDPASGTVMALVPSGDYSGFGLNPASGYRLSLRSDPLIQAQPFNAVNFPASRARTAVAFDRLLSEYVMFGGLVYDPETREHTGSSAITWAYGGNDWRVASFASGTGSFPAPRYGHSLVFDASRGRTIMFGGIPNGTDQFLDRPWEWNGVSWVRGPVGPIARFNAAMVYDSANSRVLLVGGSPVAAPGASLSDLWEYRVPTAPRIQNQPRRIVALEGEPVRMEVTLAPDATLRQPLWRRRGTAMTDAPGYVGSQTSTLMISSVTFGDAGAYEFLISNDAGRAISDPVFLEVLCRVDADRSGFVDSDDFIAFTEAFERGCVSVGFGAELPDPECRARGDFDYSGFVDSDDFVGYIEAFSAGC
ncbi:MAG: hypothetical protein SFY95_00025 [Planctomycetota bacterium]|nr:hypothetical protein [Planctomycetota bacterium]